jgi:hypothetical protein
MLDKPKLVERLLLLLLLLLLLVRCVSTVRRSRSGPRSRVCDAALALREPRALAHRRRGLVIGRRMLTVEVRAHALDAPYVLVQFLLAPLEWRHVD